MPTVTFPYETLKRLKLVSLNPLVLELAGQHVKFRTIVTDDAGAVVSDMESDAKRVSVGESAGLKLEDFEPVFHAAALRTVEQHEATISEKEAAIATAASEKATELAAKNAELATAAAAHAAEKAAKDAELAVKAAEVAAENAVAVAAKALAVKTAEVAAVKKDGPERAAKEAEAAQLAAQVAAKDAALAFIKLPEKEQRDQKIRDEIARLEAELDKSAVRMKYGLKVFQL